MAQWHYLIRSAQNGLEGWIAMAKREPFVCDGHPVHEPGDLWFQFGDTEAEARAKIEAEVKAMMN